MHKVYLLGINADELTTAQKKLVSRCSCVVATGRHTGLITPGNLEIIPMAPVKEMLLTVAQKLETVDVAILASGDPLFYGIGRKLLQTFKQEEVEIYPGVSSMQLAFARFKEPWDDAVFVSLHGRESGNLARLLLAHRKVFVLTDRDNSPAMIAKTMLAHLQRCGQKALADEYEVFVGENLGLADEKLTRGSLDEIAGLNFGDLNVMILKKQSNTEGREVSFSFGLMEEEIAHSRGLITKNEVRAATLHTLRLPSIGVFWDIGAGSGSISLEAARLCPQLDVFAVERHPQEVANIKTNICRFGLHNITLIRGEAPAMLTDLPAPDRVFVGGSGGSLQEIIKFAALRLADHGRVVINGVTGKTQKTAPALLHDCGLKVTISEMSITRKQYPGTATASEPFNTIAVIVGIK